MTGRSGPRPFDVDRTIYVFAPAKGVPLSFITLDPVGANLPIEHRYGGWDLLGKLVVGPANRPFMWMIELAIEQDGFYIHDGGDGDPAQSTRPPST